MVLVPKAQQQFDFTLFILENHHSKQQLPKDTLMFNGTPS